MTAPDEPCVCGTEFPHDCLAGEHVNRVITTAPGREAATERTTAADWRNWAEGFQEGWDQAAAQDAQ